MQAVGCRHLERPEHGISNSGFGAHAFLRTFIVLFTMLPRLSTRCRFFRQNVSIVLQRRAWLNPQLHEKYLVYLTFRFY